VSWYIRPEYLPKTAFGGCFKCRAARRPGERVLDPNLTTTALPHWIVPGDQDGYMMFCESCIGEAAGLLGWIHPLKAAELVAEHADTVAALERTQAELLAAEDAVAALRRIDAQKPGRPAPATARTHGR